MQWPAGTRGAEGFNPYRYTGRELYASTLRPGMAGRFFGETWGRHSATPDGYSAGGAFVLPVIAGGMSSWQAEISAGASGDLLAGVPMDGTGAISMDVSGDMALIITLSGTGSASFDASGSLAMTIGMAGDGALSLDGAGTLAMIVPFSGAGAFDIAGLGSLRGVVSMDGSWGGSEPLSADGLAEAVWAKTNANGTPYGTVVTSAEKNAKLAVGLSA